MVGAQAVWLMVRARGYCWAWALALLLPVFPVFTWAKPHLELEVKLDPATRQFAARAMLSDPQGLRGFRLGPGFEVTELELNGKPAKNRRWRDGTLLPTGTRRVEITYQGMLAPTPTLDHRQAPGQRGGTAGPEGSFLPASAGWYPDPGSLFSHRVTLH
ncbi:MAG: hypothetical protein ACK4N6_06570, partial [Rhodocyclaceae bacterium]